MENGTVNLTYVAFPIHAAVLLRAAWTKLWRAYPYFYCQLGLSLVASVALLYVWVSYPANYRAWYWDLQTLTMLTACASLLEIARLGYTESEEARRFGLTMFRGVCLLVVGFGMTYLVFLRDTGSQILSINFERDFRTVQALTLLTLLAGVFYFGLPLGRNLNGIFLGYGIYISSSLVTLALESRFLRLFDPLWRLLQPAAYLASLLIYLFCLWTYQLAAL